MAKLKNDLLAGNAYMLGQLDDRLTRTDQSEHTPFNGQRNFIAVDRLFGRDHKNSGFGKKRLINQVTE